MSAPDVQPKLACPFCGKDRSLVMDTRPTAKGDAIWRRRQCMACDKRFSTRETICAQRRRYIRHP